MKEKILLVEDEPDAISLYGGQLRRDGFEVIGAKNADEGIDAVKKHKPDLVLLDLMMPGKSGFEVLEMIKKDPELSPTPVIALTNMAEEVGHERAISGGAAAYVVKAERTPAQVSILVKQVLSEPKKE
jgi:CheY-like chemotaxis protein